MVIVCYRLLSIVNDFFIDNNRWTIVSVTSISFDFQYQSITRACLHEGRGPQVGEVTRLGGIKKNNSPLHAIFLKITEWLLSM